MLTKQHRMPEQKCPTCKTRLGACTSIDHQQPPKPNDVTICYECAELLVYGDSLELKKADLEATLPNLSNEQLSVIVNTRLHIMKKMTEAQG